MKKKYVTLLLSLVLGFVFLSDSLLRAEEPIPIEKPDQIILITAERFTFTPSKIKVKKGSLVEIVLRSEDTDHGFPRKVKDDYESNSAQKKQVDIPLNVLVLVEQDII